MTLTIFQARTHTCNNKTSLTLTQTLCIPTLKSLIFTPHFPKNTTFYPDLALPTMEAFSLLKYWRSSTAPAVNGNVTTILTAVSSPNDHDHGNDDEGPFFDMEFSVPVEELEQGSKGDNESDEEVFHLVEKPGSVTEIDEVFVKGELEPEVLVQKPATPSDELVSESNAKTNYAEPFQSRFKSATNFRVLMLKLKKNKEGEKIETKKEGKANKLFTVKFKIEEIPIKSVFKRDNSSKSRAGTKKEKPDDTGTEEKKFSKDAMRRYLKMVSKRYGEKVRFSGEAPPASPGVALPCVERRRDDSLMQQQDGIQSAILHCKRSYNSSRDSDMSMLSRLVSDPSHDPCKHTNTVNKCSGELKENDL